MSAEKLKTPPRVGLRDMMRNMKDIFNTLTRVPLRYPEVFLTGIPGIKKVYVVCHPDLAEYVLRKNYRNYPKAKGYEVLALLLGKGLVTNEGDSWHKQRTLIQPAFHRETLRRVCEITTSSTAQLLERWKKQEGQTINFTREMAELTIDIVAKSLFTTDVSSDQIQIIYRNVNFLNEAADHMLRNPFSMPVYIPTSRNRRMKQYIAELDEIVYGIINRRKTEKDPPPDLLQLLLEARYEETGTGMSDLQIRDEVMTIFLAGHETTVNALSWTWYLLKQHTAELEKLKDESSKYADGREPLFEEIPSLVYGKQVMNESMRLYPPVPVVGRRAVKEDVVEGYKVTTDADVAINIAGIHRHPAYWTDANDFIPARFENYDVKGSNRFVFMPFGGGPRLCIGNNFAMMEMQLINAMLSARVDMTLESRNVKPIALITLKPQNGVMMKLNKVRAKQDVPQMEEVG